MKLIILAAAFALGFMAIPEKREEPRQIELSCEQAFEAKAAAMVEGMALLDRSDEESNLVKHLVYRAKALGLEGLWHSLNEFTSENCTERKA